MNKFVILLFLVGFVKVFAQDVTTTSAESTSSKEAPANETSHEGEDKLSVEAKAALQKIKDLKKQEFEIFKSLSEKDRKELGHVIRAAHPQPPHHKQGKDVKKFKRHIKKGSKHGPKHGVTGEPEGTTEAQPEITTAAV